ncbi:cbb3-type cytochrome c oxidase subunit I [Sphingobacterium sp. FBM7-1]|uniref:cytochrome c oxidase subunit I n=1 Tax=Sphingobacterium sp. FBM7-1 TaxID=2886688 RepID=UPI001D0F6732|nr:cbb3-type cytochrome c oxidase subunit I [Sphingobacterium sp. FBM7-1]MCC2599635.1 cbb3-type cytochrome c oxidase subunit I [Sphingobacterium sp. FBM7-1]
MSSTVISHGAAHHDAHDHHQETFLTKYVFSQDHKMIAKQFLITGIVMAVFAMMLSILFRIQLAWPDTDFPILEVFLGKWAEGGRIKPDFFLSLVTIHGTMMVFFVLTAGLSGTFSNLLIPYQLGARDMASPFMNMLSYWFFLTACVIMTASFFVESGPAAAGWTIYPPLSSVPTSIAGSGLGMTLWLISMALFIISQVLGGVNYISTILNMRTKGMDLWKMPLTIWSFFLTAIVGLLSFPVLVSAVVLLFFDRSVGTSFYLSDLVVQGEILPNEGGSPILFQHLFWFLGHPEVYIVVMPAMGLTSEIISTNSRKPIFGYHAMVYSLVGITVLSFIVWGHHMFVTGMNPFLGGVFMITTLIIAVPSAVKAFNYTATLWRGNIRFTPAMMFAIGMVSFFVSGGVTGLYVGNAALDINLHDTYFVVAHFHLVMGSASIFGMLAGVYHWYPKMFGRMMDTKLGYLHFWITFICAYLVFFPMHFMGIDGVPRRYYTFTAFPFMDKWFSVNLLITWAAIVAALAQVAFLWNFFASIWKGKKATQNPWAANTLEWTTPVEHIHGNWPGEIPTVYRWPYDYSKPGHDTDFIPQHIPYSETMSSNLPHDFEGNEEAIRIQNEWNKANNREVIEG